MAPSSDHGKIDTDSPATATLGNARNYVGVQCRAAVYKLLFPDFSQRLNLVAGYRRKLISLGTGVFLHLFSDTFRHLGLLALQEKLGVIRVFPKGCQHD